jgi:hypothetical protein
MNGFNQVRTRDMAQLLGRYSRNESSRGIEPVRRFAEEFAKRRSGLGDGLLIGCSLFLAFLQQRPPGGLTHRPTLKLHALRWQIYLHEHTGFATRGLRLQAIQFRIWYFFGWKIRLL